MCHTSMLVGWPETLKIFGGLRQAHGGKRSWYECVFGVERVSSREVRIFVF